MFFFFQAEDGIRYTSVTGVQTCALPIYRRLGYSTESEIQEQRDDPERERDDDLESRLHPLNCLVLTAPPQPVPGRELDLAAHDALSLAHIAAHVPPPHIDRHLIVQVAAFAPNHRWAG